MGCGYCITLADPETDPDGFTWSKRYKVHKYLSTSRRTGQQQDQDQDIASKKISPSWLVAATAVVLVYLKLRMHTSVRATCPVPADYKDTRVLAPARAIGSGVRAPCGDESVRSPPLICGQLLCVFRARKQQQSWCTCECACLCRYY